MIHEVLTPEDDKLSYSAVPALVSSRADRAPGWRMAPLLGNAYSVGKLCLFGGP